MTRMEELDALMKSYVLPHMKPKLIKRHGRDYTYVGLTCRCKSCTKAHRIACAQWEAKNAEHRKKYQRERYLRKVLASASRTL